MAFDTVLPAISPWVKRLSSLGSKMARAILDFLHNTITPPYQTVPILVWFLVIWTFLCNQKDLFLKGDFYDTDDYMRMVQVFNWLDGASWYDLRQPRLNPPQGIIMHWTRLVDIPLAIVQKLGELAGLPRLLAGEVTAFIVPATLMLLLFLLVRAMARPFLSRSQAALTALVIPFQRYVLFNFSPGRTDHHDYMELISAYGFLALFRCYFFPQRKLWPISAGIAAALSLWIGAEGLIGLVLFMGAFSILLIFEGRRLARPAWIFGVSLFLAACTILPLARRPSEWWAFNFDSFSMFYVFLAALAGTFMVGAARISHLSRWLWRAGGMAILSIALMAFLFWCFPGFRHGPYSQVDPRFAAFFFDIIQEAQPLWKVLIPIRVNYDIIPERVWAFLLAFCFLAATIWKTRRNKPACLRWAVCLWYLFVPYVLSMVWEQRVLPYAEVFSILPLTALIIWTWERARKKYQGRTLFWVEVFTFVFILPFPNVLFGALANDSPLLSQTLLYPPPTQSPTCDKHALASLLNTTAYRDHPYMVLTAMDDTPELMYRTPHYFISAPYHRDAQGNLDALAILGEKNWHTAETRARARGIELVAVCTYFSNTYLTSDGLNIPDRLAATGPTVYNPDGTPAKQALPPNATLIQHLVIGEHPDWLVPVKLDARSDFKVYAVKPLKPKKKARKAQTPPSPPKEAAP